MANACSTPPAFEGSHRSCCQPGTSKAGVGRQLPHRGCRLGICAGSDENCRRDSTPDSAVRKTSYTRASHAQAASTGNRVPCSSQKLAGPAFELQFPASSGQHIDATSKLQGSFPTNTEKAAVYTDAFAYLARVEDSGQAQNSSNRVEFAARLERPGVGRASSRPRPAKQLGVHSDHCK